MSKPETYDFGGWATKFNHKCSDGRTILKHAFQTSDGKKVPLVWMHNHTDADKVLGHAILEEREEGVYAYCCLNNTDAGKNAKELVQHGDVSALSIYANQLKQNSKKEVVHGVIREVSLVLAGANPGAFIDAIAHSDDGEDLGDAKIFNDDEKFEMYHSEEDPANKQEEPKEEEQPKQETPKEEKEGEDLEHKDKTEVKLDDDETIQDVINSMTEKQQAVFYMMVGAAAEEANNGGQDMKHNAFEGITNSKGEELTHAEFLDVIEDAQKNGRSLKETFLAHGIQNIERLFPEDKMVGNGAPTAVDNDQEWVKYVMAHVHRTPFSRVKSTYAVLTGAEARARGYVKGNQKVEEVIAAFKRRIDPQTVYKLQKLDRDDVIDITDFDVIAWIKGEMRGKLEEELARAFLIGDGRSVESNDKISPDHIKPIYGDNSVYTINRVLTRKEGDDDYAFAKAFIKDVVKSRKDYKGKGNPALFTTEDMLTNMLLIEDLNGRVIYETVDKLKTALRVSEIVTVPPMEGLKRTDSGFDYNLLGMLVNLGDYNVGADKGGQVSLFDDFDINYNKLEYLIETRCSGALVNPYSAITFEEKVAVAEDEQANG